MLYVQNHYVWETGEPAFVKWFIRQPATLLGGAALQREEGLQQHYVAGAVEAYLAECGVAMSRWLTRFQFLSWTFTSWLQLQHLELMLAYCVNVCACFASTTDDVCGAGFGSCRH